MQLILLSRKPTLYSTRRVVEAAEGRGHDIRVVDFGRCCLTLAPERTGMLLGDESIEGVDGVIARVSATAGAHGIAVVRQFEMMDVPCINSSLSIGRSRDKRRSLQILARRGIGIPRTAVADHPEDADRLLESVGEPPYIVKVVEGTQGMGVVRAETKIAARSVIEALHGLQAHILVQEYIGEAEGADIRCFVVGDKVVASMRRQGAPGEFRSNLHRGGSARAEDLSADERKTAVAAAKAMGLAVAGVDLLRSNRGPLVMEVNSSPGLEGIEGATGVDVAAEIIQLLEQKVPKGHRGNRSSRH